MPTLNPINQKFILHWGEMGTKWGVNRTVAQIHALLYLSQKPLTAEDIAETLGVARSNVSNSLRELQNWGIVKIIHVMGDRRDHFETMGDVWEMLRIVLEERKKREWDPTLEMLRECAAAATKPSATDEHTRTRIRSMLDFFETFGGFYDQFKTMPTPMAIKAAKLGGKLRKFIGLG